MLGQQFVRLIFSINLFKFWCNSWWDATWFERLLLIHSSVTSQWYKTKGGHQKDFIQFFPVEYFPSNSLNTDTKMFLNISELSMSEWIFSKKRWPCGRSWWIHDTSWTCHPYGSTWRWMRYNAHGYQHQRLHRTSTKSTNCNSAPPKLIQRRIDRLHRLCQSHWSNLNTTILWRWVKWWYYLSKKACPNY